MAGKDNECVSWFVQSYYKPYVATAVLTEPVVDQTKDSVTLCKVLLSGLKASDVNYSTNPKISELRHEYERERSSSFAETDYLNVNIKPLGSPTDPRPSMGTSNIHDSSPIRVAICETPRGRHRICVSQTLLRAHNTDVIIRRTAIER